MAFLETPRFPSDINYGVVGGPHYKTHLIEKNSGWENANVVWPQGRHEYDVVYAVKHQASIEQLLAFFHAMKGKSTGFRFNDVADNKSCSADSIPSFSDQLVEGVVDGSNTLFQLAKRYSQGVITTVRLIQKPVSGTVLIGISGLSVGNATVDIATGIITFSQDSSDAITTITQAYPCVVTANNSLVANDTVHLSGMVGMSELNDKRYRVLSRTSTTMTLDVDSVNFSPYVSGGVYHTLPQSGEVVTAGFEFDVPVRFAEDAVAIRIDSRYTRSIETLRLIEVRV